MRTAVAGLYDRGRELAAVTLVSDGARVFLIDDDREVIDLLGGGQGVFAIALGPVIDQFEADIAGFPSEPAEPVVDSDSQSA